MHQHGTNQWSQSQREDPKESKPNLEKGPKQMRTTIPDKKETKRRERQTFHASSSQAPPKNIRDFKISPLYFLKEG